MHGQDRLVNAPNTTVMPKITPSLGSVFHTGFASNNLWVSQGGFLPDPPVCWLFSGMSAAGISAQAPLGGSTVTHPNNTACRLGQLTFPGVKNAAIAAGYVRCDLSKNLKTEQKLPCMYTLGDIMDKYDISDSDLELPSDFKSVYQIDTATDTALITNKRGSDIFTQKVAYGSRQDTASLGLPLYVCHPQYNNIPKLVLGETTVLQPDIACGIPQRGISHTLLRDCVCGIIARTYTRGSGSNYVAKIVRIIPQTERVDRAVLRSQSTI